MPRKRPQAKPPQKAEPREVVGLKSFKVLVDEGWSFGLSDAEPIVQERQDGTWVVLYPQEGFVPNATRQAWPYTESGWPGATGDDPADLDAALAHARFVTNLEPRIELLKRRR